MAYLCVPSVRIGGISCAVPSSAEHFSAYADAFGQSAVEKISRMTGVVHRRIASATECSSDLCTAASERLLEQTGWSRDSIELLVFVSQTGDYMLPSTACCVHDRLGLSPDCAAFDLNLGCSGFVYGLYTASSIVALGGAYRALLLVGDTVSKIVSPLDRSTVLIFGDAGSATTLEHDSAAPPMHFLMTSEGRGMANLIVPAGGFRNPRSVDTSVRTERDDGSVRSDEDLYMNGAELLAYTLAEVPKLIRSALDRASMTVEEVDHFAFHQANKFMIDHFARKAGIPAAKVPINLDRYGNTSSVSIPLLIASELSDAVASGRQRILMAGYGVGYSAGACIADIGPTQHVGVFDLQP